MITKAWWTPHTHIHQTQTHIRLLTSFMLFDWGPFPGVVYTVSWCNKLDGFYVPSRPLSWQFIHIRISKAALILHGRLSIHTHRPFQINRSGCLVWLFPWPSSWSLITVTTGDLLYLLILNERLDHSDRMPLQIGLFVKSCQSRETVALIRWTNPCPLTIV